MSKTYRIRKQRIRPTFHLGIVELPPCLSALNSELRGSYAAASSVGPGEELGKAVNLIVMTGIGEGEDLIEEVAAPGCGLGQEDLSGLKLAALGIEAGFLVAFRPTGDGPDVMLMAQVLDELDPGAHVFDEDGSGGMVAGLGQYGALQVRILKPGPIDVHEVKVFALNIPAGADRIVIELCSFRGGIPALNNLVAAFAGRQGVIRSEPLLLDHKPARRHWALLILGGEGGSPQGRLDPVQGIERLTGGMQDVAHGAGYLFGIADTHLMRGFGKGGQVEMNPALFLHDMGDQIIGMKPLHDQDDDAVSLGIKAAVEGIVIPLPGAFPFQVGIGVCRLHGVIDDDEVTTPAGQGAADRGAEPEAFLVKPLLGRN